MRNGNNVAGRHTRPSVLAVRAAMLFMLALVGLCIAPALAQDHLSPRARSEAVVRALATGQADSFEAAARANFSDAALARRTPEQRAQFVSRVANAFGHVTIGDIVEGSDGVRVSLHGDGAASGMIIFTFDQTPEQRIAGISVDLAEGPPPPPEVAAADRLYATTDAMVPSGDHVLATRLYAPKGRTTFPILVLMQGSGGESFTDVPYTRILAQAFATQGIGVIAYDKAGTGQSTGTLTGSNFEALGADAASVVQYARTLPQVGQIGIWAHSQADWALGYTLQRVEPVSFAIMVSPGGVNPFDQVAHFLHLQVLSWGLSPAQAEDADRMHRAVALYYAGRASYRSAQAEVDRNRGEPWFHRVVTHPYWDEITPEGRVLTPEQLATALRERPNDFELYMSASSFRSYRRDYERHLRMPTLTIYGADDPLVPVTASRRVFESVFAHDRGRIHDFRVFEGAGHEIRTSAGVVVPEYLSLMASWARARFDADGVTPTEFRRGGG